MYIWNGLFWAKSHKFLSHINSRLYSNLWKGLTDSLFMSTHTHTHTHTHWSGLFPGSVSKEGCWLLLTEQLYTQETQHAHTHTTHIFVSWLSSFLYLVFPVCFLSFPICMSWFFPFLCLGFPQFAFPVSVSCLSPFLCLGHFFCVSWLFESHFFVNFLLSLSWLSSWSCHWSHWPGLAGNTEYITTTGLWPLTDQRWHSISLTHCRERKKIGRRYAAHLEWRAPVVASPTPHTHMWSSTLHFHSTSCLHRVNIPTYIISHTAPIAQVELHVRT